MIIVVNYCVHVLLTLGFINAQGAQRLISGLLYPRVFSVKLSEKFTGKIIRTLVRTVDLNFHSWVA